MRRLLPSLAGVPLLPSLAGVLCLCLLAAPVAAKEQMIDAVSFAERKVRLDGMLKEWPGLTRLSETQSGRVKRGDPKASGLVGYDSKFLYVAMRVKDSHFVRTRAFGANEDYAVLSLAFPLRGGGHKNYSVKLYPGKPGKSVGVVKIPGAGKVSGSAIVEASADDGFTFEAKVPWRAFSVAKVSRSGVRASLRYHDADGGRTTVVATSKAVGGRMPLMTLDAEYALYQSVIRPKGINSKAVRVLVGNVAGDHMLERVAIYDRYLAVTGWNYRGGKEFYFQDLKILNPRDLKGLTLKDVTGDGHDEIIVQRREGTASRAHTYLEVLHFGSSKSAPEVIFRHEIGISGEHGSVDNTVEFKRNKGKFDILVARGKHRHLATDEWNEAVAGGDTRPALLPWQKVSLRRYSWRGSEFELIDEKTRKPSVDGPARRGSKMWSGKTRPQRQGDDEGPLNAAASDARLTAPRAPTSDELLTKVYSLYRADRGTKKRKPSFDFVINVASDGLPERVLVHGKDLVAFGAHFREGTSYAYTTIGVKEAKHILSVTAMDVTGDGYAEIIVQGVVPTKASKSLGGKVVTRHAVFVYKVRQSGITRIFAAETGRSLGDDSVIGELAFIQKNGDILVELRAGSVYGWTEKTYPFPQDRGPSGGLEPLYLPWSAVTVRTYRYTRKGFVPVD